MTRIIHPAAEQGYTGQAGAYERGRPGYPSQLLPWLRAAVGLQPGRTVVEVGAGTGKFTPLLLATGAAVIAVEPVTAMGAQLAARYPRLRVLPCSAQALTLADASADAIVCAQSFHWFAECAALDEFARVLRPGGALGLVWNVRDERCDWVAALMRIVTPHAGNAPLLAGGAWRQAFPHPAFGPLAPTTWPHAVEGLPERVIVDHARSISFVAALPPAERARVDARVHRLITEHPLLRGRKLVRFPFQTQAYVARRLPDLPADT